MKVCTYLATEILNNGHFIKHVNQDKKTIDEKKFRDSMKSFMSGHSGFSFYCCVFTILYLQNRLNYILGLRNKENTSHWPMYILKGLQIFRPFIQGGLLSLASYIAMTRISDYMHHPMVTKLQM